MGDLKVVPMAPLFSVMDGSASDVLSCDGIYIATDGRTLAGLLPPVAKQLQSQNIDPRMASSLQPEELRKAFAAAKVPLAQEDKVVGSYTFSQVLAALNDPVWDSRRVAGPGNTAISYVSPVKDQGSCGACVAFAATAIAEIAVAVANESAVNTNDYSEQWPSCSAGWYMSAAADVLVKKGIPAEANYPYIARSSCTLYAPPERFPDGAFTRATYTDLSLAKQHIRQWGAVTSYFAVYNDFFDWQSPTPYKWDRVSWLSGYHQMAVVGYNDTGQYWIAKNSWGSLWGDKGYIYISYDAGAETCRSCLADCGAVGRNGARYCCGDGVCSSAAGENSTLCAADCPTTACNNNRVCNYEAGERCVGPDSPGGGCADCGVCSASGPHCGDGVCSFRRKGYSESCFSCPMDCASCLDEYFCGDGLCSSDLGESAATCSRDCGTWRFPPAAPGISLADENGGGGGGAGRRRLLRASPLKSFWI
ncbi:hypothetical protein GPECTOR_18g13 [Gonium pectorale]|uniref:Peptidase C1A papain C-terminal domain-containing protein n=1 Tax=Gonium pectorale TaxID=33097 RepID=A0A150GJI8_GONPE|nr:hypothetical protein GPECTOR_18g13 [Gonium pectorale]|eukprot:KXZ49973.1 hypothetical protein GPECTOR_18g13 [Gonium pectorale]